MTKRTAKVHVKRIGTDEVVHSVSVRLPCSESRQERLLRGMLRNMNRDDYYVDDSELDGARSN